VRSWCGDEQGMTRRLELVASRRTAGR